MTRIVDTLMSSLTQDAPVRQVLIGLHWTVVCSRHCGMAATLASDQPHGAAPVPSVGHLQEKTALELAQWARSPDLLQASVGVAAVNSLLDVDETAALQMNAAEVLAERGRTRNIALIGHFPFVSELRSAARNLWVIEQNPAEGDYPAEAASDLIPKADIVAITSSTLINHTVDGLLGLCSPDALVMLLGPSTPLAPILFEHGIVILSGTCVVNESSVLRTAAQGASFRQVEGVKLLTFIHGKEHT